MGDCTFTRGVEGADLCNNELSRDVSMTNGEGCLGEGTRFDANEAVVVRCLRGESSQLLVLALKIKERRSESNVLKR